LKPKIADMEYYLDNVLNPEHLSGLTKKYKIEITESSDYYRRAEIHVLAVNESEAKKFVYDNLYEYDDKIDWDPDSDNNELDINEIVEVKE
tara:strand:- start:199 stop:471 length:273 start_codon:yes stop_codon:yes gene_type:complete